MTIMLLHYDMTMMTMIEVPDQNALYEDTLMTTLD